MGLPGGSQGRVDIMSQVREQVQALHLVLTGEFDAAIDEYNKLKAEVEAKLTFVKTAEDATKVKAEADEYAATTTKAADDLMAAARAENERVMAAGQEALKARDSLDAATAQLVSDKSTFDENITLIRAGVAKEQEELKSAQKKLADDQYALQQAQDRLAVDQKTLSSRLEALKKL